MGRRNFNKKYGKRNKQNQKLKINQTNKKTNERTTKQHKHTTKQTTNKRKQTNTQTKQTHRHKQSEQNKHNKSTHTNKRTHTKETNKKHKHKQTQINYFFEKQPERTQTTTTNNTIQRPSQRQRVYPDFDSTDDLKTKRYHKQQQIQLKALPQHTQTFNPAGCQQTRMAAAGGGRGAKARAGGQRTRW